MLRESWLLGYLNEDEYRRVAQIAPIRGHQDTTEEDLAGRALTTKEIQSILRACVLDKTCAGPRDLGVIALGYGLGLRRVEISRAQIADYDQHKQVLTVRGKGNKLRTLPIEGGARQALEKWLAIRGDESGLLFYGINKAGQMHTKSLNTQSIHNLFKKRTDQAEVANTAFHDLRRTFVSDLLEQGVDVAMVAKLAGHANPTTTARYDRRTMERRRASIKKIGLRLPSF